MCQKIIGLTIESQGPQVQIGEICCIKSEKSDKKVMAEVVGFKDKTVILMPLGDIEDVGPGWWESTGKNPGCV